MRHLEPEEIISYIARIRQNNNLLWMNLLRIAFRCDPKESRKIMKKITKNDREVSRWTARL